jgi:hypothetical protein
MLEDDFVVSVSELAINPHTNAHELKRILRVKQLMDFRWCKIREIRV